MKRMPSTAAWSAASLSPHADQRRRGERGGLGDPHQLEREVAIGPLLVSSELKCSPSRGGWDGGRHSAARSRPSPSPSSAARTPQERRSRNLHQRPGHYDRGVSDPARLSRRRIPDALAAAVEEKLALAEQRAGRRAGACGRRDAVGSGRYSGGRRPARLADDRRAHARGARVELERVCGEVRDGWDRGRRAARHGRLLAGAGGAAPLVRRRGRGRPRLHVLDSTDARDRCRGRAGGASTRSAPCSSSLRSPAARSSRCRCSRTSGHWSPDGRQLRRDHRPRLGPRAARPRARLPAHLLRRSRHRRPLQRAVGLRDRARGADGGRRRAPARRRGSAEAVGRRSGRDSDGSAHGSEPAAYGSGRRSARSHRRVATS